MSVGRRETLRRVLSICVKELCDELVNKLRNKRKRQWVREWIRRRDRLGASATLLKELASEDPQSYYNIMRLTVPKFEELLKMVSPLIKKEDTRWREAISCRTKLEIALRYMASGDSLKSLQYLFRVPYNTISVLLPEVLSAICEVLQPFMKVRLLIFFNSNNLQYYVKLK